MFIESLIRIDAPFSILKYFRNIYELFGASYPLMQKQIMLKILHEDELFDVDYPFFEKYECDLCMLADDEEGMCDFYYEGISLCDLQSNVFYTQWPYEHSFFVFLLLSGCFLMLLIVGWMLVARKYVIFILLCFEVLFLLLFILFLLAGLSCGACLTQVVSLIFYILAFIACEAVLGLSFVILRTRYGAL